MGGQDSFVEGAGERYSFRFPRFLQNLSQMMQGEGRETDWIYGTRPSGSCPARATVRFGETHKGTPPRWIWPRSNEAGDSLVTTRYMRQGKALQDPTPLLRFS